MVFGSHRSDTRRRRRQYPAKFSSPSPLSPGGRHHQQGYGRTRSSSCPYRIRSHRSDGATQPAQRGTAGHRRGLSAGRGRNSKHSEFGFHSSAGRLPTITSGPYAPAWTTTRLPPAATKLPIGSAAKRRRAAPGQYSIARAWHPLMASPRPDTRGGGGWVDRMKAGCRPAAASGTCPSARIATAHHHSSPVRTPGGSPVRAEHRAGCRHASKNGGFSAPTRRDRSIQRRPVRPIPRDVVRRSRPCLRWATHTAICTEKQ